MIDVKRVAKAAHRVAQPYGFDLDDCEQEVHLYLLSLRSYADHDDAYHAVVARRRVIRAARKFGLLQPDPGFVLRDLVDGEYDGPADTIVDLIDAVGGDGAEWLYARAGKGMTYVEAREALGWTEYYTKKVVRETGAKLLKLLGAE